jgi:hypothetical protein
MAISDGGLAHSSTLEACVPLVDLDGRQSRNRKIRDAIGLDQPDST